MTLALVARLVTNEVAERIAVRMEYDRHRETGIRSPNYMGWSEPHVPRLQGLRLGLASSILIDGARPSLKVCRSWNDATGN